MPSTSPLVSVAVAAYNHEKYIGACIRSILGQTFADLEVVVVDDGSTDGTAQAIAACTDPRVVSIRQENQGPSCAFNRAIAACRGQFIALMSGDDICHLDRIETQLKAHGEAGGGVIFANMDNIDDDGRPIESGLLRKDFFLVPPLSQAQILEKFFNSLNFLAAPTCFALAKDLRDAGPFDPLLYQLQDFEMWIRLVKRQRFTILPQCLVSYRNRRGDQNLSAPSASKNRRAEKELYLVMRRFFDAVPAALFREAFRPQPSAGAAPSPVVLKCEQAFLYLNHPSVPLARLIGIEYLHGLLNTAEGADALRTYFGYSHLDLAKLLLRLELKQNQTCLFVDTGSQFNQEECRHTLCGHLDDRFELEFDLADFPSIKQLRWDPVEYQLCKVLLTKVAWQDRAGQTHHLDLATLTANGVRDTDGTFSFLTFDPNIYLPIAGDVRRLALEGRWQVDDPYSSLAKMEHLYREQLEKVDERDLEIERLRNQLDERTLEAEERWAQLEKLHRSRIMRWTTAMKALLRFAPRRRGA